MAVKAAVVQVLLLLLLLEEEEMVAMVTLVEGHLHRQQLGPGGRRDGEAEHRHTRREDRLDAAHPPLPLASRRQQRKQILREAANADEWDGQAKAPSVVEDARVAACDLKRAAAGWRAPAVPRATWSAATRPAAPRPAARRAA